jgi:hypothetical protein
MNKQALKIEPATVGRYALGGAVTGGSVAAILNLLHMIQQMRQERAELTKPVGTDENTIMLTLPRKAAEVKADVTEPTRVKTKTGLRRGWASGPRTQTRDAFDGRFGQKTAAQGWPTLTASALAAIAGTAAGAALVNHIYQRKQQQDLKAELSAAQQEYADLLRGGAGAKTAEWVEAWFDGIEKDAAGDRVFGLLNYPIAALALLSILGAGGAGYITKRILDEKQKEQEERSLDIPRARRIVFRTEPEPDRGKLASADDVDCVRTALCVMLDKLDTAPHILNQPEVKTAMAEAKTSEAALLKLAADVDALIRHLQGNPNLRRIIQRVTMARHPILKHFRWALNLPGVSHFADQKLYNSIQPTTNSRPGIPGVVGAAPAKAASEKKGVGIATDFATDILGSMVGQRRNADKDAERLAAALVKVQAAAKAKKQHVQQDKLQLSAEDPNAAEFLDTNRKKILAVVRRMAMEGQL